MLHQAPMSPLMKVHVALAQFARDTKQQIDQLHSFSCSCYAPLGYRHNADGC